MSESLIWIKMFVALPLGVIFLVSAGIQAGTDTRGDMIEMAKKILLILGTVVLISIYPAIIQKLSATADSFAADRGQFNDMLVMQRMIKDMGSEAITIETGVFSYLNPSSWIQLLRQALGIIDISLIYCILYIPSTIGFFISNVLIKAFLAVAVTLSPFFLSMIPFRHTNSIGMRFLMSTIALSISLIALVIFDQILRAHSGAALLALLPAGVGAVATGAGVVADLGAVSATIAGGTVALGTLGLVFMVLLLAGFIFMVILIAAYVITPFAFVRFALSGGIVDAAGGLTGAMQVGRGAAMPIIESGEAVGRGIKSGQAAVASASSGSGKGPVAGGGMKISENALSSAPLPTLNSPPPTNSV